MSVICNHDCFNCQYPDCINDEITLDEYREIAERDAEIKWWNRLIPNSERQSLILKRGRDKAWREANKESIKAWREANKEHLRAYNKAYREAQKLANAANNETLTTARQVQNGI